MNSRMPAESMSHHTLDDLPDDLVPAEPRVGKKQDGRQAKDLILDKYHSGWDRRFVLGRSRSEVSFNK